MQKHLITTMQAPTVWKWFQQKGGIAIWEWVNLAHPGASWTTPRLTDRGTPSTKPSWECADEPVRVIRDPDKVDGVPDREYLRFRVAVHPGSQGLVEKCTGASSRHMRDAVAKAGDHQSDYATQEDIVMQPTNRIGLLAWAAHKESRQ